MTQCSDCLTHRRQELHCCSGRSPQVPVNRALLGLSCFFKSCPSQYFSPHSPLFSITCGFSKGSFASSRRSFTEQWELAEPNRSAARRISLSALNLRW